MTFWQMPAFAFGGDYNPEQWPEDTWPEDVRLMREAGVGLATVGVFAWARLEPTPGAYDFGWLDRVLDLLHEGGIRVDLATATASPPPWLARLHPESLPEREDGVRLWPGSRQAYCPSSPQYRQVAIALVSALARRYGDHPALALWHIGNEYGCHTAECFCDVSAEAFRAWLQRRYGTLDALNEAWATAFWSQWYGTWEDILPPRVSPTVRNPAQQLDWRRFSSDALLDLFRAERDLLREVTPHIPSTTNLMGLFKPTDGWAWAREMDIVSLDHYLDHRTDDPRDDLRLNGDLARSLAGGGPWLLMEHSTGAVNWQPRNLAKEPGQMRRDTLTHIARGADGACYFQWRASRGGAERYHSAMLPHAGTDSRAWRELVALGRDVAALCELRGTRVEADVALVLDWESWWAVEGPAHPAWDLDFKSALRACHRALTELGLTADIVHPRGDLSRYRLLVAPLLHLLDDTGAAALDSYVRGGGSLITTFFSGIVDACGRVRLGGYPGALRELLGIRVDEFQPLRAGAEIALSDGSRGSLWSEPVELRGAEPVTAFAEGMPAGRPAVTRHGVERGTAWYTATWPDDNGLLRLIGRAARAAGCRPPVTGAPSGLEAVRRTGPEASYLFLLNHSDADAAVPASGTDLLTGDAFDGTVTVPPGGVRVLREPGDR